MLKSLIIVTVLPPTLAIAQRSQQLPQPRQPGQWCPEGWMASGNYCVSGSDKALQAVPKNGWCPAGWHELRGGATRKTSVQTICGSARPAA
jgi:hypothetical protein